MHVYRIQRENPTKGRLTVVPDSQAPIARASRTSSATQKYLAWPSRTEKNLSRNEAQWRGERP